MPVPVETGQWQDARAREIVDGAADLVRRTAKDAGAVADIAGTEIYHSTAIPTLIELSERAKMIVAGGRARRLARSSRKPGQFQGMTANVIPRLAPIRRR